MSGTGDISTGLLRFALWLARVTGGRARKPHIVLPATAGSLGDQAVLSGLADVITSAGLDAPVQVTLRDWHPHTCPNVPESVSLAINEGRFRSSVSLVRVLRDCSQLIILGTDVIEGNYSRSHVRDLVLLSNQAVALGIPVHICGFSFSASPNEEAVQWLRRLDRRVRCSSRDPLSARRFEDHTGRPAEVVMDPAFVLQPSLNADAALDAFKWIRRRHTAGDVLLGVNVNAITYRTRPADVCDAYLSALSEILMDRFVSVLLLPHDLRDDQSDVTPLTVIHHVLEGRYPGRCRLLGSPLAACEVKYLAGACDLIISGRLHLAVAALSQGRPVIGIEYHDKFLGIFRHFDAETLLLSQAQLLEGGKLASLVFHALDNLCDFREGLARSRPLVDEGILRLRATLAAANGQPAPARRKSLR